MHVCVCMWVGVCVCLCVHVRVWVRARDKSLRVKSMLSLSGLLGDNSTAGRCLHLVCVNNIKISCYSQIDTDPIVSYFVQFHCLTFVCCCQLACRHFEFLQKLASQAGNLMKPCRSYDTWPKHTNNEEQTPFVTGDNKAVRKCSSKKPFSTKQIYFAWRQLKKSKMTVLYWSCEDSLEYLVDQQVLWPSLLQWYNKYCRLVKRLAACFCAHTSVSSRVSYWCFCF